MKKLLVLTVAILMVSTVHAEGWFSSLLNFSPTWFQAKSIKLKKEKKVKSHTTKVQTSKKQKKGTENTFDFSHIRTTQGKKMIKMRTTTDPDAVLQLQEDAAEKASRNDPMFKKVEVRNLPDGVEITYTRN